MKVEDFIITRRFLSLSTGHVSPGTRDWLNEQSSLVTDLQENPNGPHPKIHILPSVYGWIFVADRDGVEHLNWPDEIKAIARKAIELNCDWVELDCDADIMKDLPTWDW